MRTFPQRVEDWDTLFDALYGPYTWCGALCCYLTVDLDYSKMHIVNSRGTLERTFWLYMQLMGS